MSKRFIKNSLVLLASMFVFSCPAQNINSKDTNNPNINNNQLPLKAKGIGKILYSSIFVDENDGLENTKTYIYDGNSSKLFKLTNKGIREGLLKWSFDGSKIIAYRVDEVNHINIIVIYDASGNEIDNIGEPPPEGDFISFHNSNKVLFGSNNLVPDNPYPELSANIYDPVSKTTKKITGTESFNYSRYLPELSLDDSLVFITDAKGSNANNMKSQIYTFNINNGEKNLITEFDGLENSLIYRLKWHPLDRTKFVALIGDGDLYFIDINSKEKKLISLKSKRKIFEIKFSPISNEIFIYPAEGGTILLNLETNEETKYSENLDWTCNKETFLLNEKDGIYKTDRKISKKELIIKNDTGTDYNINISDMTCS